MVYSTTIGFRTDKVDATAIKSCVVQTPDGSNIKANKINIVGKGQKSTLSIRSERAIIHPEAGQAPNIFKPKH